MRRSLLGTTVFTLVLALVATAATAAPPQADVRFATFNASLNRGSAGLLTTHLSNPAEDDQYRRQAKNVAEVVQRVRPDVLLVNEFDPLDNAAADPGPRGPLPRQLPRGVAERRAADRVSVRLH